VHKAIVVVALLFACRGKQLQTHGSASAPPPALPPGAPAASCAGDAVKTASGCVRGDAAGGVTAFRGIPYAAPPVGALRWRPPQSAATWSGVREAHALGPACPQMDKPDGTKVAWNEDCLTLNVWTPHVAASPKLPVMVWIHGGGLVQGSSNLPLYDGQHLAAQGVVLVSFNYRLGALGFLAHPALTAEDTAHHASGNFGLHDQIAALAWVKANIAAFGGDPSNVTIFGESAGGESVCALMSSPLATGLFHKAIIESAQCVDYGKPLRALHAAHGRAEAAEGQGERIAKALGCTTGDLAACMRGKSPEQVLDAAPPAVGFLGAGEHFGFTVEDHALPRSPAEALKAGLPAIPMILGSTADEGTMFTSHIRLQRPIAYRLVVRKIFGAQAPRVLAAYPPGDAPKHAFDDLVTDVVFTCPTRTAARSLAKHTHAVYRFLFSHVTAKARANGMGARHGSEVPFVFDTAQSPTEDEQALARTMVGYWVAFAKTGDPNHAGAPAWPAYDAAKDPYLDLDTTVAARAGLRSAKCDVLDEALGELVAPEE
jgi:para-nitrobenzyl esterase